ncbi:hypothetical protein ILYODFUR_030535 [Ilyodon furcidens]|uniref:Secreted protein n=1 Tax=Ilyodon furcidens TaxID=33524 RepID=A0ABV0U9T9_9TELE
MFFGRCGMCLFLIQQWFPPCNSAMDAIFPQSFSFDESLTLTLNEASEACAALDVLGCFVTSWMSYRCALGVILVSLPFLKHCSMFSLFVDWHPVYLEYQLFRNGFLTLSRLIDVNDSENHLFLDFRLKNDLFFRCFSRLHFVK